MGISIVDKSDIAIVNTSRFKRATLEHKDFPNAKLYFRNCSIEVLQSFFVAIGVEYNPNQDRYSVLNTSNECIIIEIHENHTKDYIGYTLFI